MGSISSPLVLVTLLLLAHQVCFNSAQQLGVNYGMVGDNLPSPQDVISLFKSNNIGSIRLFEPKPEVLEALRNSDILVSLGMRNEDITSIASSQDAANSWVNTNVAPYKDEVTFRYVTIGNEVIPGPFAKDVAMAMNHISNALIAIGQVGAEVTTVVPATVLGTSFPPSAGAFSAEALGPMTDIATVLQQTQRPLMINVYPYFALASNPDQISLDYALFQSQQPIVTDGPLNYNNLFDAIVDAFNAALEKINLADVLVGVSETGWPTAGNEPYTTISNAQTYNTNLKKHVAEAGTPRRPNVRMDLFIFAMFNENQKNGGAVEQNFGLFYPNMQPVYPLF
ncbi:hypothetical protein IFM89_037104 [Coptis chinensis]|uniref:Glucan endo-1,3-beta-D-glucosidase n=1 Tax=Coptis chinensis TaxID=261450 RepID=A0A835HMJ8_9MAGN|nr:hypothetical protein IFM89_037104 [Coptis chinensis]